MLLFCAMRILLLSVLLFNCLGRSENSFDCPERCQCHSNTDDASIHLVCKWDEINWRALTVLRDPDRVRTLTIRCTRGSTKTNIPPSGAFAWLRHLDRLQIDRCPLENIPERLFQGLNRLVSLILRHTRITTLPDGLFQYALNLLTVDLSSNDLRGAEPNALSVLTNLIQLDLSNNSLTFWGNSLMGLDKLRVLSLDSNLLSNVDSRRLPITLTDLSVRKNRITSWHSSDQNHMLRRLDLSHNQVDFVASSGSLNYFPDHLETLDLSYNHIRIIHDGAFEGKRNLSMLDLRYNRLVELRELSIADAKNRIRLLLVGNPFRCVCHLKWIIHPITKMSAMVMDLDMINCTHVLNDRVLSILEADRRSDLLCPYRQLCDVDGCAVEDNCTCTSRCPELCTCWSSSDTDRTKKNVINCTGREKSISLDEIPENATEIHLAEGVMVEEWEAVEDTFDHVISLNLSSSHLQKVPPLDRLFPNLQHLDLSNNELKRLPSLITLTHLQSIDISSNRLNTLNSTILSLFSTMKRVRIGGRSNIFECDCLSPTPLQRWVMIERNRKKLKDYENILCRLRRDNRSITVNLSYMDPSHEQWPCDQDFDDDHSTTSIEMSHSASTTTGKRPRPRDETIPFNRNTTEHSTSKSAIRTVSTSPRSATTRMPQHRPRPVTETSADRRVLITMAICSLLLLLICAICILVMLIYHRFCNVRSIVSRTTWRKVRRKKRHSINGTISGDENQRISGDEKQRISGDENQRSKRLSL